MDFRYPNITEGATEREQIRQLKNYLFQFVDQLQYVIGSFGSGASGGSTTANVTNVVVSTNVPQTASVDSNEIAFSDIKALIIKSADIIDAYYEEISKRLEGVYVAQSDFGIYKEQTSIDIDAKSTGIELSFANVQEVMEQLDGSLHDMQTEVDSNIGGIKDELKNLNFSIAEVSANIRPGLLYYDGDGIPVYGLEIGQRTKIDDVEVFDKFARFTSDRLSFYDNNDNEVAYISDRKLYINHAEVTSTFRMGGFVRTVLADGSIVKRWTKGGEG